MNKIALSPGLLTRYMGSRALQGVGGNVMGVPGVMNKMLRGTGEQAAARVPTLQHWAQRGGPQAIRGQASAVASASKNSPRVINSRLGRQEDIAEGVKTTHLRPYDQNFADSRDVMTDAVDGLKFSNYTGDNMKTEYTEGFMSKCAELGIDPEALMKSAIDRDSRLWDYTTPTGPIIGAIRGDNSGNALGGAVKGLAGEVGGGIAGGAAGTGTGITLGMLTALLSKGRINPRVAGRVGGVLGAGVGVGVGAAEGSHYATAKTPPERKKIQAKKEETAEKKTKGKEKKAEYQEGFLSRMAELKG